MMAEMNINKFKWKGINDNDNDNYHDNAYNKNNSKLI